MAWTVSTDATDTADAVVELARQLSLEDGTSRIAESDAALIFASAHHGEDPIALSAALGDVLGKTPFIGWIGACAFDGMTLQEGGPGLTILVLKDAEAYVRSSPARALGSHVAAELVADMPQGRARLLAVPAVPFDADNLLPVLDETPVPLAGAICIGMQNHPPSALAPNLTETGTAALLTLDDRHLLLGLAQATKALGPSRTVTAAEGNVLRELDGRPAMEVMLADLPPEHRQDLSQLRGTLFAGLAAADGSAFLMRHVMGADPQTGAIMIAGRPAPGSELIFAMLDDASARDDLEATLFSLSQTLEGRSPEAVIVFDCAARGAQLMGTPLYDLERTIDVLGGPDIPVVGIMGGGEIANLDIQSQVFGYSAVIAVLLRAD